LDYFLDIIPHPTSPERRGEESIFAKHIAKWIAGPIAAYMKENYKKIDELNFDKSEFIKFINIVNE
jgi:Asp-tRNA(Asn)/Glu-tRNA(Gln) amidotransferase B subunit